MFRQHRLRKHKSCGSFFRTYSHFISWVLEYDVGIYNTGYIAVVKVNFESKNHCAVQCTHDDPYFFYWSALRFVICLSFHRGFFFFLFVKKTDVEKTRCFHGIVGHFFICPHNQSPQYIYICIYQYIVLIEFYAFNLY